MTEDKKDHPLVKSVEEMMADPERRQRLVGAAEAALEAKITEQFKWSLPSTVSDVCVKFIEEEVAPAILQHLMDHKGVIIQSAIAAADEIGAKLAEELARKASQNLTGYKMSSIAKDLFS